MMDIKNALINSASEVSVQFGIQSVYIGESEEEQLVSVSPVNVLIGLSGWLRGNVILGLDQNTALKIVSLMMGGMNIMAFDEITKSALAEFTNMILGVAIAKVDSSEMIDYSPPTVILGKKLFLVISRLKSYKLTFELDKCRYDLVFCIE